MRVDEDLRVLREASSRDRHTRLTRRLVAGPRVLVPRHPVPVRAGRGKRVVRLVERERVHGIGERVLAAFLLSVAFEAEVARVDLLWLVQVYHHDAYAALDRADRIALAASEAGDGARGVSQRTLDDVDRIEVVLRNQLQVPDMDLLVRVAGDEERELAAHLVDGLADVCFADLLQLDLSIHRINLPKLDHRVPATANQIALPVHRKGVDVLHRQLVLADRLRLRLRVVRVPDLDRVVGVRDEYWGRARRWLLCLIAEAKVLLHLLRHFLEANAQNRPISAGHGGRLILWSLVGCVRTIAREARGPAHLLSLDRVDLKLSVPRCDGADLLRALDLHHHDG